jgi:TRAP-type uncharacterized transport system substrate-binding protein
MNQNNLTEHAPPDPGETESVGLWGLTQRERLWGIGVLLAALALIVALIALFWRPGPPSRVIMSTGAEDGAYHAYAQRYREILARSGVELVLLPSAGAVENLERLRSRHDGVMLTLAQGGLVQPGDETRIVSLGAVAYEPLWLFSRVSLPMDRFTDFRGLKIAGGVPGSGTRKVVEQLLERMGMTGPGHPPLVPLSGLKAAEALEQGTVDVAALISAPDGAAVQRLLRANDIVLVSMRRADALVRQFPMLTRVDIPEGAVDLARNLPARDTALVSLKASLVAAQDIHPVLVDLLLDAAREVHGGAGLIRRSGDFPSAEASEFPMSPDAERYYKSGPSALRHYLPYWAVVWIQRLIFFGLPVLAIGIPLARAMPIVYRWSIRRRIYRWYGELSFIERAVAQGQGQRDEQLRRLGEIEDRVNRLRIPAAYAGEAYALRSHVQMVREQLLER